MILNLVVVFTTTPVKWEEGRGKDFKFVHEAFQLASTSGGLHFGGCGQALRPFCASDVILLSNPPRRLQERRQQDGEFNLPQEIVVNCEYQTTFVWDFRQAALF